MLFLLSRGRDLRLWKSGRNGKAAIEYSSGLMELIAQTESPADPLEADQAAASQLEGATVQTVLGAPALVVQGNTSGNCPSPGKGSVAPCIPAQKNPTSVTLYLGGFALDVDAPGTYSTDEVLRVAGTIT